jgi:hypothetical protein
MLLALEFESTLCLLFLRGPALCLSERWSLRHPSMLQLQGTLIAGVPTSEKVERKARKRLTEEGGSKPFYSSSRHLWVTWSSCRELMSWEPTQAIAWFCKESFTGTQLHFYT